MKITEKQLQNARDYVAYGMHEEPIRSVLLAGLALLDDTHVAAAYDERAPRIVKCAHCGSIVKNSECKASEMPIGTISESMLICKECADREQDDIKEMETANERMDADTMQELYYEYMDSLRAPAYENDKS